MRRVQALIAAVIFDVDGVLVCTDELHYRAWNAIADRHGIPFDRTINHRLRGVSRVESLEIILERSPRAFSSDEKAVMAALKNDLLQESLKALGPRDALPGARRLLHELRQRGIRLAAGSSSRNARTILERTALLPLLDVAVDGNDVANSKPHPEVFLACADRLGVAPARCVVVEDALSGVAAARAAGMKWLGIGTVETMPGVAPLVAGLDCVTADALIAWTPLQSASARSTSSTA